MAAAVGREHILDEIRRCAEENGGRPPGRRQFLSAAGIPPSEVDRHWVRWSDAVVEAGFEPNRFQSRYDDAAVLDLLAGLVRDLGHFPVKNELRHQSQDDPAFPNDKTLLTRFGGKAALITRLLDHTNTRPEWSDVADICAGIPSAADSPVIEQPTSEPTLGFVYLMRSGKYHKIGRTNSTGRRLYEVGILLPEPLVLVHQIKTDDPVGIEEYWHRRFADRRTRGEWFRLTADDVATFKRRKFM